MSDRRLLTLLAVAAATSLGVMMAAGQVTLDSKSSCGPVPPSGSYTDGSQYEKNLAELLAALSTAAAAGNNSGSFHFHSGSVGGGADQAWGLATCFADSDAARCQDCLGKVASIGGLTELCRLAAHMRSASFSNSSACRLRYADAPFLGSADTGDLSESPALFDVVDAADVASVNTTRWRLLSQLAESAAAAGGHGQPQRLAYGSLPYTAARNGSQVLVYGLAQCTGDLKPSECTRCLAYLLANMPNATGGSVGVFSCYLRYQVNEPIIDKIAGPASPQPAVPSGAARLSPLRSESSKAPLITAALAAAAGAVMLLLTGV